MLVGEPGHGGELVGQLLLPHFGLGGELRLVGRGLVGQPLLERPRLFAELGLVGAGQVRESHLVHAGVLGQLRLQRGTVGAELPLQDRHMLLPLLGVLGLRGAEIAFRTAQLSPAPDQQSYAHGAGRRGRRSGRGRGYSLRARERGGDRPTPRANGISHQPYQAPGARAAGGGVASSICILRSDTNVRGCEDRPHSGGRTTGRPVTITPTRCAARELIGFEP